MEEILSAIRKESDKKTDIYIAKFVPIIFNMICEEKMKPSSKMELLAAFRAMDKEKKGFLDCRWFEKTMAEEGEVFAEQELTTMRRLAKDPDSGYIDYEYYVNQLQVRVVPDVYSLIPETAESTTNRTSAVKSTIRDSTATNE